MIDISGIDKGAVLAALYNASRPQGMGFVHYDPTPMTPEQGAELLKQGSYFDYLKGRVMKVDLSRNNLEERLYDRDNGMGAAALALEALRSTGDPNAAPITELHQQGKLDAAATVKTSFDQDSRFDEHVGMGVVTLGFSDVANFLGPAVDKSLDEE